MTPAPGDAFVAGLAFALVIALGALLWIFWPRLELQRTPEENATVLAVALVLSVAILGLAFGAEIVRRGSVEEVERIVTTSRGGRVLGLVTPAAIAVAALVWSVERRKRHDPSPGILGVAVGAAMLLALIVGVLAAAFRLLRPAL